jgi:hypothetical protein
MKTAAHILVALTLALGAFGWWGIETAAGRRAFDEMAGMIPYGALVVGCLCLLGAVVLYVLLWQRQRGNIS